MITALLLALAACAERDLRDIYDQVEASVVEAPLTREEVTAALKDSLARGISRGAASASLKNGYYGDARLRIPFPPEIRKVENALRDAGLGEEVDRFVRQLNRSAEQAAAKAKPIFVKAITSMTIRDAFEILNGDPDAATQYLIRTTGDDLRASATGSTKPAPRATTATSCAPTTRCPSSARSIPISSAMPPIRPSKGCSC